MTSNDDRRLSDKVAIVTGAGRGIGRAIAERFVREGAKVVINYNKSESEAVELAETLRRTAGAQPMTIRADVSKSTDVHGMVSLVKDRLGRIDVLVNNAGIIARRPFLEATEADWDRTIDVNLKGTYLCCKAVAPIMMEQKRGKIINISSVSAYSGLASAAGHPDYVASKAGVLGLTRSIAIALGPYVNVNAICPGMIETDMVGTLSEEQREARLGETPLKRMGIPSNIADAAVFLASADSDWITGEIMTVSGGRAMK